MTSRKSSIVIIPGSYCPDYFYYDFRHLLQKAGYDVHLHDLPSASGAPSLPPASLTDDGKYFHSVIESLAKQGKDVVVIAHSYGGAVAREAVHNLSKQYRQKSDQPGGIVRLIYISTMFMNPGENGMEMFARHAEKLTFPAANFTEPVDPETAGGPQYLRQNPVKAWTFFFGDLSKENGIKWAVRMSMHTMLAWITPASSLPDDAKEVPVTFLKCLKDEVFPLNFQSAMIEMLLSEGTKVDVREIDSAHCPNVSRPDELSNIVINAIEQDA